MEGFIFAKKGETMQIKFENGKMIEAEKVSYSVFKTQDYNKFNSIKVNRNINNVHVNKIMKSIQKDNLLHANPILVNQWGQVIDGQHRLSAAINLKLEVYFLIVPNLGNRALNILNSCQKNWSSQDFLQAHIADPTRSKDAKTGYITIEQLSKAYEVSLSVAMSLLGMESRDRQEMVSGELNPFSPAEVVLANRCGPIIQEMHKKLGIHASICKSRNFIRALRIIVNAPGCDRNTLRRKIGIQSKRILPCTNSTAYLQMLLDIYNYKNSKPLILQRR